MPKKPPPPPPAPPPPMFELRLSSTYAPVPYGDPLTPVAVPTGETAFQAATREIFAYVLMAGLLPDAVKDLALEWHYLDGGGSWSPFWRSEGHVELAQCPTDQPTGRKAYAGNFGQAWRLSVYATQITQFSLYGRWQAKLFDAAQPTPVVVVDFTINP